MKCIIQHQSLLLSRLHSPIQNTPHLITYWSTLPSAGPNYYCSMNNKSTGEFIDPTKAIRCAVINASKKDAEQYPTYDVLPCPYPFLVKLPYRYIHHKSPATPTRVTRIELTSRAILSRTPGVEASPQYREGLLIDYVMVDLRGNCIQIARARESQSQQKGISRSPQSRHS